MKPPPVIDGAVALPGPSELARIRARGRVRGVLPLLGPAFVAAIAYVDPGNFATNVQGGAQYGYLLIWTVLAANLMAMLVQHLSAKIGTATGKNLPQLCREHYPRYASVALWAQAEVMAIATDLAEVVGGAIALNLLFGVPLAVAGVMVGIVAFGLLALQERGYRRFELVIAGLLAIVLLGFLYEALRVGIDGHALARGFVPHLRGSGSVLLATGIVGATVMPHVVYLHSALTQKRIPLRDDGERLSLMRFQRLDVMLAMGVAGVVNIVMLAVFAALFSHHGGSDTIAGAHAALGSVLGAGAALTFALALLASGFAASSVGTQAGQVVMDGFIHRRIPIAVRRLVTLVPAIAILVVGVDPTRALVLSQVVLSFGIPFALIPLVLFTQRREIMGALVNSRLTSTAGWAVAATIVALNVLLLWQTLS